MKILLKVLTFSFALALFIFSPKISVAQNFELPKSADLLSVTMIPSIPGPFDHVVIDLKSYMTDLDKATISWSSPGLSKSGMGEKHFEFNVGDVGSITTVDIAIRTAEGNIITRKISVRPGNVDLLWEASTYTPLLYKGKALYTAGADVTVVAMPNIVDERGIRLESKNLIYRWKVNGKLQETSSGFGKNYLRTINPSSLKELTVEVEVSSLSGNTKAKGSITLNEVNPMILFYENNPLLGVVYERALLSHIALSQKEMTLSAIPYFFSTENKNSGINYSWSLNEKPVTERGSALTLRMETNEGGTALVGLETKHASKMFQFTRNSLLIDFGQKTR